ncbi:MAG: YbhB/YbcL family Raf kinase inhibitor-like protein [Chthoniobacterales bacterium]|nr:YbhB/YbcL family Raf kinase inhibitor-like protein [Chthoniobacterales bacterium]
MRITSPAFADGGSIPAKFTADGGDISPPLEIGGVPAAAKSLVLIVDDPDAPRGTWNHWLLWNIVPGITQIAEGTAPSGAAAGRNDFGETNYRGPSPPSGTHRYFFRLLALDTTLDLKAGSTRAKLDRAMQGHVMAEAVLMGRYGR